MTISIAPTLWRVPTSNLLTAEQLLPLSEQLSLQLTAISQRFRHITLANSLAVEDMVITDLIAQTQLPISVFVLNTGKLHPETLSYLNHIQERYPQLQWSVFEPEPSDLNDFNQQHNFSAIYESLTARKSCCYARKIAPLHRALANQEAWITGQRREQSTTRTQLALEEFDASHQITKFNPLAVWTQQQIWSYIHQQQIPINPVYEQGIPSIGCEPCTKPIRQGEDLRAGRWWWENQQSKECGLHRN